MSKNFKGYMGDQIGKLGTAVGRRWKNRMVYASYQGKVKNPRTDEQMAVRARFSALVELSKRFIDAYSKGMANYAKQKGLTIGNQFFNSNWDAVTGDGGTSVAVDFSDIKLSLGSLKGVGFSSARFDETLTVKVNYAANLSGYKAN